MCFIMCFSYFKYFNMSDNEDAVVKSHDEAVEENEDYISKSEDSILDQSLDGLKTELKNFNNIQFSGNEEKVEIIYEFLQVCDCKYYINKVL